MAQTIKLKRSATAGGAPTTSQLELGEVAINTYDGKMYIKKSVAGTESIVEISGGDSGTGIIDEFLYTATAGQTAFSGNDDNSDFLSYVIGAIQVFLNGILLDPETDYTATNGALITLVSAAAVNDYLQIFSFKKKISDGNVTVDSFSGNNSTTAFTLSIDPGDENNTRVFVDGVYQSKANYTVSGTTLTFSTAPPSGTAIEVESGNRSVTLPTTENLDFPDNVKLRLGTSQDLEIYHDASDSLINDNGTGSLKLQTGGSTKLEVTSTGVDVTGNIAVSGTVDGVDIAARDAVLTSTTTTAGAALPKAGGAMTGAITTNSTFDGRDVAADGTKLDGIETAATADQTQSEINALGITATGLSGTPAISVANITTTGELRGPASLVIDPAGIGDNTGTVVIKGNLQVDGATTTINSTTLTVDDLNLTLASGAANGTAANGAGITIDGASATLTYQSTGDNWAFNKSLNVTGGVTTANGSTSAPTYSFTNDTDTGMFLSSVGYLALTVAGSKQLELGNGIIYTNSTGKIRSASNSGTLELSGGGAEVGGQILLSGGGGDGNIVFKTSVSSSSATERMRIDSSGQVGIGNITPAQTLEIHNSVAGDYTDFGLRGTGHKYVIGVGNDAVATVNDKWYLYDNDNSAFRMVVDTAGNVGIGTSSPNTNVQVYHATDDTSINVNTGTGGSYPKKTGISFGATSTSLGGDATFTGGAGIQAINTAAANNLTEMAFFTTSGGTPTERMRIDELGKVGIGTNNPIFKLDVAGTARFTADVYAENHIYTQRIRHNGDVDNYIGFGTDIQSFVTGNSTRAQFSNTLVRFNQEGLNQDFQVFGQNDDNLLFVDASADKVGIGTDSPSRKLDVRGAVRFSVNTSSHETFVFSTQGVDEAKQIMKNASSVDTIVLNTGGNSWLNGGNVGIGDSAPQDFLEVRSTSLGGITISNANHNQAALSFARSSTATARVFITEPNAAHTSAMHFQTSDASGSSPNLITAMSIDDSQHVGIGTINPQDRLHVALDSSTTNAEVEVIRVEATSSGTPAVGFGPFIDFRGDRINGGPDSYGRLGFEADAMPSTTVDGAFVVQTAEDGTYSERLRITSDGKVLIGDTASVTSDLLQIESPASGGGGGIHIRRNDSNNDQQVGIVRFGNNSNANLASIIGKTDGSVDNGKLIFKTRPSGAGIEERMVIDSAGNVGIGVTPKTDWHTGYDAIQIGESSAFFGKSAGDEVFMAQNARYTSSGWKYNSSGTATLFDMQSGNTRWRRAVSGSDDGTVSWSESMFIDTAGKVGIGTASPTTLTEIRGVVPTLTLSSSESKTWSQEDDIAKISFFSRDGSGIGAHETGFIVNKTENSGASLSGVLVFGVANYNTVAAEAMRIDHDGNVGIGTDSPVNNSNRTTLGLQGVWGGQLDIMVGSTVHAQFGTDNFSSGQSCRIQSQDGIVFKAGGSTERMRISSTGVLTSKSHIITGIDNTAFEVKTNHSGNPSALRVAGSGSINGIGGSFQNFTVLNVMQDSGSQKSIYAAGDIKTDGNIVIGTSGKGVSFAASGNYSGMASELLDDYEEGTWTPDLKANGGSSVTHNTGNTKGYYTKIGDLVTVSGTIQWTSNGSNANGGYTVIAGLPYPCKNVSNGRCTGSLGAISGFADAENLNLIIDPNNQFIYITRQTGTSYNHNNTISASGAIYGFTLTYRVG
jgi:hypothetical protein